MTPAAPLPRLHPAWWISTVFGVGCLPRAPGTWGSLATVLVVAPFLEYISIYYMVILILTIIVLGWWSAAAFVARLGREDPQEIVIDEVAGQLLALAAAPPTLIGIAAAFLLFRLFDILKPFPARWCDRNLPGGLGVMADDVVAGIYSFIIIYLGVFIAKSV